MNIEIKDYTPNNLKEICKIHNQAFAEWIDTLGNLYGYLPITENDVEQWLESDYSDILIAYEDETPIGYLHYQIVKIKGAENDISCMEIIETTEGRGQSKIAVIPGKQRRGVGIMLLRHVLKISKEKNVDTVIAYVYNHNLAIINILQKLGFSHERVFYYSHLSESIPLAHDSVLAEFDLTKEIPPQIKQPIEEITIREFKPDDLADIQQIFTECRPDMVENFSGTDVGGYWLEENWAEKTLVAELNGEVVGCMEYNKLGLIGIPGVKKKYQKIGIGTSILHQLLVEMKSEGFTKALADTGVILPNAIKLYQKLGFDVSRELWVWVKSIKH